MMDSMLSIVPPAVRRLALLMIHRFALYAIDATLTTQPTPTYLKIVLNERGCLQLSDASFQFIVRGLVVGQFVSRVLFGMTGLAWYFEDNQISFKLHS